MHLDNGHRDCRDSITNNYRGVGIAARIEDDAVVAAICLLELIYNLALDVRLVVVDGMCRVSCAKSSEVLLEALTSVYLGLATPQ